MPIELDYLTPAGPVRSRFTVQGSRFIATLAPVTTEESFKRVLSSVRDEFPDATHHPYACRLGSGNIILERSSDDREPAGSAGEPMLQFLQGKNVSDAVVIGTRYFGGTRLGIGGLRRAYRACVRLCLEEAVLNRKEQMSIYRLCFEYEDYGSVTRLIDSIHGEVVKTAYSNRVTLKVIIPARAVEILEKGFISACRGRGALDKI